MDTPVEQDAPERSWDRRRTIWAVVAAVAIAAIATLLVVGLLNRGVDNTIDEAIDRGERADAPSFTLPVMAPGPGVGDVGTEVSIEDFRGKVVVLNIWASWCDPCKDEAPILDSVAKRYRDRGVVVLGLNVRDVQDSALAFDRTYNLTFASVRDGEGDVMGRYGATAVPETFIVDREGRVAAALRGALDTDPQRGNIDDFTRVLETVVAE